MLVANTGQKVSLLRACSEYAEAATKLEGRNLGAVIEAYLKTVETVKRKDIKEATEQFVAERELKTRARDGKRPALSPEHHYLTSLWLREFGDGFPGRAVCDLTKDHLNAYMGQHSALGTKTRNERRAVGKMFLRWAVERDYLTVGQRLFEAAAFKHETPDDSEIECYSADDLHALLSRASRAPAPKPEGEKPEPDFRDLLPMLVLAGVAGLRIREAARLTLEELFRRPDRLEVKASETKTRSRRLVQICPALAAWL